MKGFWKKVWKAPKKHNKKHDIPLRTIRQGDIPAISVNNNRFYSRAYWDNYIDSIIDSVKEDKSTIIDMLMYGKLDHATIVMNLLAGKEPTYEMRIYKVAEKSPFGEDEDE